MLISCSYNWTFAQADLCDGCYVWTFANDKGERDESTRLLTDAVEDIISQYPSCTLLQRSRFAKLQEQIANEKAIQSLNFAPSAIKDELKVIKAKRVIFGAVSRDFQGSVSLRLTFESLISSQFKSNTIFLTGEDYYNFDKRKEKLTAFVNSFINPDGKLPSPTIDKNETGSSATQTLPAISKFTKNNLLFELISCSQFGQNVECKFRVTSMGKDIDLNIGIDQGHSRIMVMNGNEFQLTETKLGDKISSSGWGNTKSLVSNIPVNCIFIFSKVAEKVEFIPKLEANCYSIQEGQYYDFLLEFRNIKVK